MKSSAHILLGLCLVGLLVFQSCERDDICAATTPTTPQLILRFYDAENPSEFKAVSNLVVAEVGAITGIEFTGDSLAIPLRTNIDITAFRFIVNATSDISDDNPINEDLVNFEYTRSEDYVSKACGFRTTYDQLRLARDGQDDGSWIQDVIIQNTTIDIEISAHIRILH